MKIPEEALPGLKAILSVDATSFDALATAFKSTSPSLTTIGLSKRVSSAISSIPSADISSILETVYGLYWIKYEEEISPRDLAVMVSDATAEMLSEEVTLTVEQKAKLTGRLERLLILDQTVGVTAKAADVLTEAERTYAEARILSDIRPVFTDSIQSAAAGIIIHNLRIDCHMRGGHQELFFTLDCRDLEQLKEAIFRAEKKTDALKAILAKSNMYNLEP